MASAIASMTICLSIDFSRATASAICRSSSLFALTAILVSSGISTGTCRMLVSVVVIGLVFGSVVFVRAAYLPGLLTGLLVLLQRLVDEIVRQDQPRLGNGVPRYGHHRLVTVARL